MSPQQAAMDRNVKDHCESRIRNAPLRQEPFPHIVVEGLLPEEFYKRLMEQFPAREIFRKADYPGVGFSRREPHYTGYGLALPADRMPAILAAVADYFQSQEFARVLLEKFAEAIPAHKHPWFGNGADDFRSRCTVHVDLPGYAIPPHPDVDDKLITYLLYMPRNESVRAYGTMLLRPKGGKATVARTGIENLFSRAVEWAARRAGVWERPWMRRLRESKPGFRLGLLSRIWLPWEWFETAAMAEAMPNHLLVFAPSERSYHAVRLDIPADHANPERPVIRGFVRKGHQPFERVEFQGD